MIDKPWLTIVAIASALKLLFIPAYRSTDFEVHRNWLAITHSLPIDRWYYESTSEWTLDYPPFFAWFEWLLSIVASRVDPAMLVVSNLNYASNACIVFQRVSVIVADFVLAFATRTYCSTLGVASSRRAFTLAVLILLNAGLLIVDHIHFQYNGLLLGLLLLSIARLKQERVLEGAFWFAVLLNMKHIFLYVAPAYILYLFRSYCFQDTQRQTGWLPRFSTFLPSRLLRLGAIVTAVFAVSFGPFIAMGQLPQVMSRLFPLKRGLTHAYWAPNVWALYNFADKTTSMLTRSASSRPSTTGGLVGDVEHVVLPSVPPIAALLLTTVSILNSFFLGARARAAGSRRVVATTGQFSALFARSRRLRLRLVPVRLARSRKGDSTRHCSAKVRTSWPSRTSPMRAIISFCLLPVSFRSFLFLFVPKRLPSRWHCVWLTISFRAALFPPFSETRRK
ncbi:dolichyl pyrophosphate Glc1Man9GlcNAc2 alpha-1,3-glucosyltransferase-like isoform X4 [Oscarella lobularis]|uniref:dolichyl pyrophosphate Glc1Man9GlcNAc2 alpha-1,3-glucosyltransferase-like isoform X4 n=1 Tax=Oscarella lobularis TaxID=121494 RepID=UPI0033131AB4